MRCKTLVVDMMNIVMRAHLRLPDLNDDKGYDSAIAYGVLQSLNRYYKEYKSENIILVWDSRHNLRKEIEPTYKAKRRENRDEESYKRMIRQVIRLKAELPKIGFCMLEKSGYEADDIIAILCGDKYKKLRPIAVLSSDNDLLQLLAKDVFQIAHKDELVTNKSFKKKYGFPPSFQMFYKALAGCGSDNVKGVPGVGKKGTEKLFEASGYNADKLFNLIDEKGYGDDFDHALRLVALPLDFKFFKLKAKQTKINRTKLAKLLDEYNIKRINVKKYLENL